MGYLEKLSRFLDYSFINKVKTRAKELEKILWDLNNVLENYSVIKFSEKEISPFWKTPLNIFQYLHKMGD